MGQWWSDCLDRLRDGPGTPDLTEAAEWFVSVTGLGHIISAAKTIGGVQREQAASRGANRHSFLHLFRSGTNLQPPCERGMPVQPRQMRHRIAELRSTVGIAGVSRPS